MENLFEFILYRKLHWMGMVKWIPYWRHDVKNSEAVAEKSTIAIVNTSQSNFVEF